MPELSAEEQSAVLNLFSSTVMRGVDAMREVVQAYFRGTVTSSLPMARSARAPARFRRTTNGSCPDPTRISPSAISKWALSAHSVRTQLS